MKGFTLLFCIVTIAVRWVSCDAGDNLDNERLLSRKHHKLHYPANYYSSKKGTYSPVIYSYQKGYTPLNYGKYGFRHLQSEGDDNTETGVERLLWKHRGHRHYHARPLRYYPVSKLNSYGTPYYQPWGYNNKKGGWRYLEEDDSDDNEGEERSLSKKHRHYHGHHYVPRYYNYPVSSKKYQSYFPHSTVGKYGGWRYLEEESEDDQDENAREDEGEERSLKRRNRYYGHYHYAPSKYNYPVSSKKYQSYFPYSTVGKYGGWRHLEEESDENDSSPVRSLFKRKHHIYRYPAPTKYSGIMPKVYHKQGVWQGKGHHGWKI